MSKAQADGEIGFSERFPARTRCRSTSTASRISFSMYNLMGVAWTKKKITQTQKAKIAQTQKAKIAQTQKTTRNKFSMGLNWIVRAQWIG